jgi:hypothetical protein
MVGLLIRGMVIMFCTEAIVEDKSYKTKRV